MLRAFLIHEDLVAYVGSSRPISDRDGAIDNSGLRDETNLGLAQ